MASPTLGAEVEELGESELRELLLDILPRKVTAEKDLFEKIAPVTEAFLRWAGSKGLVDQADDLAKKVHGWGRMRSSALPWTRPIGVRPRPSRWGAAQAGIGHHRP